MEEVESAEQESSDEVRYFHLCHTLHPHALFALLP